MGKYILAIDQSTQGTKGLLFDESGKLTARADIPHRQIINDLGWVEHDPNEIMKNVYDVCRNVLVKAEVGPEEIAALGISNQRETSLMWDKKSGEPIMNAVVWQCARAEEVCRRHEEAGEGKIVREKTGIPLSPYFPAAKWQWMMENISAAACLAKEGNLACGTIDSWLVYNLTKKKVHKTDYSNASRTQLFNLHTLTWDEQLCRSFDIPIEALPEVVMSDSVFGTTDLNGLLPNEVPICGVLGDSHGALFGQNCRRPGEIKATYGTGSSVMMNIGEKYLASENGLVTSLAWGMDGKVSYVFEGNLNYTGAVITWLKDDVQLITSPGETEALAKAANPNDETYFVPAFTGLGAPYWNAKARGILTGITRTTGRNEIVRAAVDCIAYQITDLVKLMRKESGRKIEELHVDGGPTGNRYLMQFQADQADARVSIPALQELSGMGAAYAAGISAGLYDKEKIFEQMQHTEYEPQMAAEKREKLYSGWQKAIEQVLIR
ncbi:MAG: glycerol kinase GlpK [Eubacteriales bacterium]|nr:glycerol kinase GlpK [Eubacteriales bacterium]